MIIMMRMLLVMISILMFCEARGFSISYISIINKRGEKAANPPATSRPTAPTTETETTPTPLPDNSGSKTPAPSSSGSKTQAPGSSGSKSPAPETTLIETTTTPPESTVETFVCDPECGENAVCTASGCVCTGNWGGVNCTLCANGCTDCENGCGTCKPGWSGSDCNILNVGSTGYTITDEEYWGASAVVTCDVPNTHPATHCIKVDGTAFTVTGATITAASTHAVASAIIYVMPSSTVTLNDMDFIGMNNNIIHSYQENGDGIVVNLQNVHISNQTNQMFPIYINSENTNRVETITDALNLNDCSFTYNGGTAIRILNIQLRITGCNFTDSVGVDGGAVYSKKSLVEITDSIFTGNSAQQDGGALYLRGPQDNSFISNSTFNNNKCGRNGGAIYDSSWGKLNFDSTVLYDGNTANGVNEDVYCGTAAAVGTCSGLG